VNLLKKVGVSHIAPSLFSITETFVVTGFDVKLLGATGCARVSQVNLPNRKRI
jgi:hypothetical protein